MNQSDFMKPQQNHASSTSTSSSFGERSTPNDNGSPTNVLPVRRRKIAKHKKAELANRLPQLRTITQANENSHAMEDTDVIEITPIVIASSQESTTSDLNSEKKKKKAIKKRTPVVEKETKETKQKKRKVSRQKMYENVAKTLRNSLVVQEGMLEYVENVPPLPDKIDVNKYRNKNLLALDVGSSFSKASRIHILRGKSNSCQTSHLKFGTHKENSFPTRIFYSKSLHQFNMKPPTLKTENSNDWFELENIKKIFMVQELYTIQLHGIDFNVAHVMYQLLKGLLTQLAYRSTTDEHNNKHSTLGSYSGLILTCPTNISEIVKLVYRNCALKAINEFVNPELTLEDIYIIEEFSLLKFFSDANNISTDPTLYVDIGHLTLDITVVEYDENGESKITYRNGEVGGMSILHNIIKSETGQDSFEIMKKMFDESTKVNSENEIESIAASPEPKIIEELQSCEEKIIEAMRSIVTPLCLIILQCSITKVHFAGAITSCQYFERLLDQLLSATGIMETLERIKPYLKDQYKEIQVMKVETTYEKSGNSALLDGIEQLINRSLATCDMGGISFHFSVAIPNHYKSQYHVGFLGLLENGDQSESSSSQIEQFGISVRTDINTLYVLQDFETFIIKFSPVIDVTKIGMITMKNYYDLGISEFERFSTVCLYVDHNNIVTTNPKYLVRGSVDDQYVTLEFFYTSVSRYMKSVVKIEREGRMERIPVNDVVRNVLEHSESDYTTWYGLNYETKFVLQPCSSNRLTKQEKEEESKGFEEEFKQIRPIQRQKKYLREHIMCLDDNDDEKVMSELEKACVSCGVDCGVIGLKVTSETLASYKKYLGKEELICGPICAACRNQYRRNVSYSKK